MRALLAVAAALLAFSAGQARAADPSQIDCPLTSLTEAERDGLDRFIIEQGALDDPRWRAFVAAAESCATRFHWSEAARMYAANYAFTDETLRVTRRLFEQRGIDIGPVERAMLADQAITDAPDIAAKQQALIAFVGRSSSLVRQVLGPRAADDQLAAAIGAFLLARSLHDGMRAAYIAE